MKKILLLISIIFFAYYTNAQMVPMWDSLGQGVGGNGMAVKALTTNDTNDNIIYAGGSFLTAEGKVVNNIAKWQTTCSCNDGQWSSLGSGVNNEVTALTMFKNKLIAGGAFDSAGGTHANHIASWDSINLWDSLGHGLNGQVYALASTSTALYAGGSFTLANGITVNRVAMWNGSAWSAVGAGFDTGTVNSLCMYNDTLYAGGSFTASNSNKTNFIAKWNGSSWVTVGSGMNNTVYCMTVNNNILYVGGAFTIAGGISVNYIAQLNYNIWGSLYAGTNDTVRALSPAGFVYGEIAKKATANSNSVSILVGGNFTMAGGANSNYIAMYAPNGLGSYPSDWVDMAGITKPVFSLTSNASNNYVGGVFDSVSYVSYGTVMQVNYVTQFSFVVGGGFNELHNNSEVSVFPNPAYGNFNFQLKTKTDRPEIIEVYNMMGEKVCSNPLSMKNSTFSIDISAQPAGIYLYRIEDSEGAAIASGELVVQQK